MRVGGAAEWLLEPADPEQLRDAWVAAREAGYAPRVLGGGANVIVADGVLPGVVLSTERLNRVFRPPASGAPEHELAGRMAPPPRDSDPRFVAWCGAPLPALVTKARDLGWSGLEGLVGVPGHLGGGVAMNAGGRWGELWDVVESVRVLEPDGTLRDLARADCAPRYRDGNLGERIVVGAVLRLRVATVGEVRERGREYLLEKNRVQPVSEHSCGCIFKNPDKERSGGRSAGQLVDHCGGKGMARGKAVVSERHGNFIVNRGGASATDVLALIEDVRELVAQRTGILLETEARVWAAGAGRPGELTAPG